MDLEGKVAIVTGAGGLIGRAIAVTLADDGADVVINDMVEETAEETAGLVRGLGRRALVTLGSVADTDYVEQMVEQTVGEMGRLDTMVNNAGITRDGLILRMKDDQWDLVLNVNLKGTFLFTKAVAKPMMKQKSGVIVNVASIIGLIGNAGQCNYAASKAGLIALTKSSAKELASRDIRVNAVAPGFIESKMTEVLAEDIRKKMLEVIPLGRFGLPADVAKAVLFLAGDASSYMTGQVLTVSGGMAM